jgi:glycosyltransferase involved in cell wall biosynthesis
MRQQEPQISVLIPTYDRAKLLVRALNSVLTQTYARWKLVVVDDGSTDNTREIVELFQKAASLTRIDRTDEGYIFCT